MDLAAFIDAYKEAIARRVVESYPTALPAIRAGPGAPAPAARPARRAGRRYPRRGALARGAAPHMTRK